MLASTVMTLFIAIHGASIAAMIAEHQLFQKAMKDEALRRLLWESKIQTEKTKQQVARTDQFMKRFQLELELTKRVMSQMDLWMSEKDPIKKQAHHEKFKALGKELSELVAKHKKENYQDPPKVEKKP
jgi:hypothetical protein